MNVLILAAGKKNKHRRNALNYPSNLIEIESRPLIELVMENLSSLKNLGASFIVILDRHECEKYHTDEVVKLVNSETRVIYARSDTSGAACTALLAAGYIDNDKPLLIVNGDQLLLSDHVTMLEHFFAKGWSGGIPVINDIHPRYSFIALDKENMVVEVAEKRPISRNASAGRYFFNKGSTFVRCAKKMILKDANVEGQYYVCPTYNELVLEGGKIGIYSIPRDKYINGSL
jgi:dTDP-glucose pyrophosphorylase